ncbi:MAG: M23 family metallopeptidase [Myxococcales bacterium]|nr:M23 family metallopeptidase [Myxococcales bacterium]MDP3502926.1 M23 family metallopeptidase [Myxococcales bacterium]
MKLNDAATQLESVLLKQLLHSSGVFKGSSSPGSAHAYDLFAESLADAVAKSGGMGLAKLMTAGQPDTTTPAAPMPQGHGTSRGFEHMSSGFGQRVDPLHHKPSMHTGVDLPASEGTPIPAAKAGTVIFAGERGGYGNAVELQHDDGTTTLYAHASEVLVTRGQVVPEGAVIATVGQTGRSTGPHLHLEVREGGHPIDPVRALKSYRLGVEEHGGETP